MPMNPEPPVTRTALILGRRGRLHIPGKAAHKIGDLLAEGFILHRAGLIEELTRPGGQQQSSGPLARAEGLPDGQPRGLRPDRTEAPRRGAHDRNGTPAKDLWD